MQQCQAGGRKEEEKEKSHSVFLISCSLIFLCSRYLFIYKRQCTAFMYPTPSLFSFSPHKNLHFKNSKRKNLHSYIIMLNKYLFTDLFSTCHSQICLAQCYLRFDRWDATLVCLPHQIFFLSYQHFLWFFVFQIYFGFYF